MSKNLTAIVSNLKNFLHDKEEVLLSKGTLTSDLTTIQLFYRQIDDLEDSAKEIESHYYDNKNILYNFNKRVLEIKREIDQFE